MEVLMSMFILLIGLLSVGALIPVGRFEVGQADQIDRAASVGRSAFRMLKTCGMLRPDAGNTSQHISMWYAPVAATGQLTGQLATDITNNGNFVPVANGLPYTDYDSNSSTYPPQLSYALDPWGMVYNATGQVINTSNPSAMFSSSALSPATFPAGAVSTLGAALPNVPVMARITLRAAPSLGICMSLAQAAHLFQPQDDLSYFAPPPGMTLTTPNGPAVQTYYPNQDPTVQNGVSSGGSGLTPQYRQFDGNYSWIATIVPNAPTLPNQSGGAPGSPTYQPYNNNLYTVSVAVYYKRPINLNVSVAPASQSINYPVYPERLAAVSAFPGSGIGGGEITLNTQNMTSTQSAAYLNVKRGQWIMLAGQITLTAGTSLNPTNTPTYLNIFRWYRVIGASDVVDSNGNPVTPGESTSVGMPSYSRNITLAGPDWPYLSVMANANHPITYAFLCDGVVGVYEKSMNLERPSDWSTQ